MTRTSPHYMVLEHSPWLSTWYENSAFIKIPIEEFDKKTISFTYGDSMPTFSPTINDGKEYRKKLYTYNEILKVIEKYGLPQDWNDDGKYGPERYIEVHVWSDETIDKYRSKEKVEKTIFAYNQNSNTFNNRFLEFPPYLERIIDFADLLGAGKRLLDFGCGPGNVIKQILSTGKEFDVVGVDLSQEMLKLARINVPTGSFICEDIRTVDFPDNSFDVILLSFCIVHLEGSELNTFFQRISRYLRKEGKIYLSFMEGKNDGYEKTSFSEDEIYFNYHASDDVITLLEENNISIINVTKQGYIEKNGTSTTDVFIFAEKL